MSPYRHRALLKELIKRDILLRYRGSVLGISWSFLHPVIMLSIYTFVFAVVFQARWQGGSGSKTEFALALFAGLIIFNFFAECVNKAPTLIMSNTAYVKKVVFPLEILPIVTLASAFFHFLISLLVWLLFYLSFFGMPPATITLVAVPLIPLAFIVMGLSWLLAALGVYLRDISQVVGVATTAFLFLSPIFYPLSALPQDIQWIVHLSPLTVSVEQARDLMIWGRGINLGYWLLYLAASLACAWLGFAFFQRTRKGFADVI
jgi:lipopolysaccharide transport system permease protein